MDTKYLQEVQRGMDLLENHPKTLFIGQAVEFKGHAITGQLYKYPNDKLQELPVAEDFQAGMAIGMALEGFIPVSIYPRHDFVLLGLNQIMSHLDRWTLMCPNSNPHVIIKMLVGAKEPLDGGHQHTANYIEAFKLMCQTIKVFDLKTPEEVYPAYEEALNKPGGYIISEYTELYS